MRLFLAQVNSALWRVNRLSFGTGGSDIRHGVDVFSLFLRSFFEEARLVCLCRAVDDDFALGGSKETFPECITRDDFDDDDAENWEDCLLHTRGVLDGDIAKTIFVEDFANMMTRSDDSSEERKKCVWLFFLC